VRLNTYCRRHNVHHDTVIRKGETGELRIEKRPMGRSGSREIWHVWEESVTPEVAAVATAQTTLGVAEGSPSAYGRGSGEPPEFLKSRQVIDDAFVHGRRIALDGIDEANRRAIEGWDIALTKYIALREHSAAQAAIIRYLQDGKIPEQLAAAQ
jgi:hypothetical protein